MDQNTGQSHLHLVPPGHSKHTAASAPGEYPLDLTPMHSQCHISNRTSLRARLEQWGPFQQRLTRRLGSNLHHSTSHKSTQGTLQSRQRLYAFGTTVRGQDGPFHFGARLTVVTSDHCRPRSNSLRYWSIPCPLTSTRSSLCGIMVTGALSVNYFSCWCGGESRSSIHRQSGVRVY